MPQIDFCYKALDHESDECLLWPYKRDKDGYGHVSIKHDKVRAHRVVCELVHGPAPSSQHHAAHSCRNRHCVAPKHLEWKTPKENCGDDRRRDGTTSCGEKHYYSKFTEQQIVEMCEQLATNLTTVEELAAKYGVNTCTINRIRSGETWKHVPRTLSYGTPAVIGRLKDKRKPLTVDDVIEIRRLYALGDLSQQAIANLFGAGRSTIYAIVNERTWRHLLPKKEG